MTPIIITLSLLNHSQLGRKNSGTDLGTGYGGTVCGFHTRPLCPPMRKTREIFDLHFLAKPGFCQANYCDFTKVEVPNCLLYCNTRNKFVAVRVYQAVKNPATTDKFAADFSFMPE